MKKMKIVLAAAVSSTALLLASGAYADGGPYTEGSSADYNWYTTIFAGAAFGDDLDLAIDFSEGTDSESIPLNTGYLLGWTLGYDNLFGGDVIQFRPEVELSFRQQDVDLEEVFGGEFDPGEADAFSVPTDVLSLLGNLWVDFKLGSGFTPYVGGGVGIGWADLPIFEGPVHIESTDFVWQFGGGVNFDVNERVFVGVGYRYFGGDFGESVESTSIDYEYRTHEVMGSLGVRF